MKVEGTLYRRQRGPIGLSRIRKVRVGVERNMVKIYSVLVDMSLSV